MQFKPNIANIKRLCYEKRSRVGCDNVSKYFQVAKSFLGDTQTYKTILEKKTVLSQRQKLAHQRLDLFSETFY